MPELKIKEFTFTGSVQFHDRLSFKFKEEVIEGEKLADAILRDGVEKCVICLEKGLLCFYNEGKLEQTPLATFKYNEQRYELDETQQCFKLFTKKSKNLMTINANISDLKNLRSFISSQNVTRKLIGPLNMEPAQEIRDTYFSTNHPWNLRGFVNFGIIAFVINNLYRIWTNVDNYGIWNHQVSTTGFQILMGIIAQYWAIIVLCFVEKLVYNGVIKSNLWPSIFVTSAYVVYPIWMVRQFDFTPITGLIFFTFYMGGALKLASYAHTNSHIRRIAKELKLQKSGKPSRRDSKSSIDLKNDYNNRITEDDLENVVNKTNIELIKMNLDDLSNLCQVSHALYFMIAPTQCYQLVYPRTPRIRPLFLLKKLFGLFICGSLLFVSVNQFLTPIFNEFPALVEKGEIVPLVYQYTRVVVPVMVSYMIFFLLIFEYVFNVMAELLRFGDRQFYGEWWNSRDLNEYWRLWNLPVHHFFIRHIYFPMLRKKFSKGAALWVVFFVSAVMHEYWFSMPLKLWSIKGFAGFMIQAPLMMIQKKLDKLFKGSQIGNFLFWFTIFVFGQPFGFVNYYLDYNNALSNKA